MCGHETEGSTHATSRVRSVTAYTLKKISKGFLAKKLLARGIIKTECIVLHFITGLEFFVVNNLTTCDVYCVNFIFLHVIKNMYPYMKTMSLCSLMFKRELNNKLGSVLVYFRVSRLCLIQWLI